MVGDAVAQLQAAGAALGADAVIIHSERSNNDRHVVVEGEAIHYTDKGAQVAAPGSDCVSCQKIGKPWAVYR
jgi:hypothetical protein